MPKSNTALSFETIRFQLSNAFVPDDRHFLPGYDSALFYGAYASYQYDREVSSRQYR